MEVKKMQRNRKFGMKKGKQKNLKRRPKNLYLQDFINGSISLEKRQVKEC